MTEFEPALHMPPPPETLSAEARAQMAQMAGADVPSDMEMAQMRLFAEGVQTMIGAEQRKAHPVTVTDDVIAGVPVRRIVRETGAVDRSRVLENTLASMADHAAMLGRDELGLLAKRIGLIYTAIVLAVLAALFICLLIALAFVDAFIAVNLARVLGALFVLAMLALICCLLVFLREIFLAVTSARRAIPGL